MFVDWDSFLELADRKSWAWRNLIGQTTNVFVSERTTNEILVGTNTPLSAGGYNTIRVNGTTGGIYDLMVNGTRYGSLYADATNEVALFRVGSGGKLKFQLNDATHGWYMEQNALKALTDNQDDIGAVGANRPKNIYAAGTIIAGGAITGSNVSAWASWTPTRTGWVDVGTPTVTARYCQVGAVIHFQVKVVPATTTATTAGTSYISLPTSMGASSLSGDGSFMDNTTFISVGPCVFSPSNSRCYVPSQAATGDTLTIAGWYEI